MRSACTLPHSPERQILQGPELSGSFSRESGLLFLKWMKIFNFPQGIEVERPDVSSARTIACAGAGGEGGA